MPLRKLKIVGALFLTLLLNGGVTHAQLPANRFPISAADVAMALEATGVSGAPARLDLPPGLSAASPGAELHLLSAELTPDGRIHLRLGCRSAAVCLPFLATLRPDNGNAAKDLSLLSSGMHAGLAGPRAQAPVQAIRVGDHTSLLIEDEHMRITLPVVSIDSGSVGSAVRVSSLDKKQTFRAVVLGPGAVKGELQ